MKNGTFLFWKHQILNFMETDFFFQKKFQFQQFGIFWPKKKKSLI